MSEQQSYSPPTPGPFHEKLQPFAGAFRAKVTIWFGPDQTHESAGTMKSSWQLDGLHLAQDYVGDPNEGPFPSFEGKGYWSYDTCANQYVGFWADNASPIPQMETGTVDDAGKVWTIHCQVPNPQTGGLMKKKTIITLIDNDNHKMESFVDTPQGEFKNMEIIYTRA